MESISGSGSIPHIVMFPFMSKGHTIPLLHLARLLVHRGILVTIFTTPANHPFIAQSLDRTDVSIVDLPFPENIPGIPPGIESTDKLSSMSLFIPFVTGIKLMQPLFEAALEGICSQVSCIISDGFLHWTLQPASRFGIPRLSFYGMNSYAMSISRIAMSSGLMWMHESSDEPFTIPGFPWIQVTRSHFDDTLAKRKSPTEPHSDLMSEIAIATKTSYGVLVNNFYELEKPFADYWNRECEPKAWCVGPMCLAQRTISSDVGPKPECIQWLDEKLAKNRPVLYVAFGSQAKVSLKQLREIALGLEESNVCFLWVVGKSGEELRMVDGFEERVKERGILVKEWVNQREILENKGVKGFLSHCGWNSVLEGICAEVPILGWPMLAEQWLNAKMVVEEIGVGLRVSTVDGSEKGFVTGESLRNSVIELMEGDKGRELRENVKKVAEAAKNAVAEGGSSSTALDELIGEVHRLRQINISNLNNGTFCK